MNGPAGLWRRYADLSLIERRFWREVPDRALLFFYAGVFFTFSSLGFLVDMRLLGRQSPAELAATALLGAVFSVAYAWTGIRHPLALLLVVPVHVGVMLLARNAFPELPPLAGEALQRRLSLDVAAATIGIACGYAGFIGFIVTEGTKQLGARAEIALAREIHADLVPELALVGSGFELYGRSEPATEVGGDLVDAVVVDGALYACVADVTGHGVPAGTLMGMFKAATRMALRSERELPALLRALNDVLLPLKSPSLFVTAAFLRLRPDGTAEYALAGHPPILHREARTGAVRRLSEGHLPVGLLEEQAFPAGTVALAAGDVLAIVTDGLIEVEDAAGRDLGLGGIEAVLAAGAGDASLRARAEALLGAARGHGPQQDDQSLLLVRATA